MNIEETKQALGDVPHTVDATGWRDISTAPKDGTHILGWGTLHWHGESMGEHPFWYIVFWLGDGADCWFSPASGRIDGLIKWQPLPPPPGEEVESERERIARELREYAETQGDPSGWLEVIAIAIETDWSVINDPENFKNEPCRFEVMQERDALQARCDELEAAAREADRKAEAGICQFTATGKHEFLKDVRKALRSVVDGGE